MIFDGIIFIIETLEKKLDTTRRKSFYGPHKMKLTETFLYGPTQKETKINPF